MVNTKFREKLESGEIAVESWITGISPQNAEAIGRLGFDSVLIDMQHNMVDFAEVGRSILALAGRGPSVMVRVPGNDSSMIQRVLDAGADGVMCPLVNNRREAEQFIDAVRYPPMGKRSNGAYRTDENPLDYVKTSNSKILAAVQIETIEAMDNLDAIASTPGLDILFPGPSDLKLSFDEDPVADYDNPVTAKRHIAIAEAAHRHGKWAGMLTFSPEDTRRAISWGFDYVGPAMEMAVLVSGAATILAQSRELAAQRDDLREVA